MVFPTKPINPNTSATLSIPQFCLSGSKVDPELTQDVIDTGIQSAPGQSYGQLYPYQWVNWTQYQVGQYLYWLCGPISSNSGAVAYLQAGNFDSGVNIFNDSTLKFYDSSNTNYVGFTAPTLTSTSNYVLPTSLPVSSTQFLQSDLSGNLNWIRKNVLYVFSEQQNTITWSSGTYLTDFFKPFSNNDNGLNLASWNPINGTFTAPVSALYKIELDFTVQPRSSGTPTAGTIIILMETTSFGGDYIIHSQNVPANDITLSINVYIGLNAGNQVRFFNNGTLDLLVYQTFVAKNSLAFSWNL